MSDTKRLAALLEREFAHNITPGVGIDWQVKAARILAGVSVPANPEAPDPLRTALQHVVDSPALDPDYLSWLHQECLAASQPPSGDAPCTGLDVHREWRDGMLAQGREERACACGGTVIADPLDPVPGVREHNITEAHVRYILRTSWWESIDDERSARGTTLHRAGAAGTGARRGEGGRQGAGASVQGGPGDRDTDAAARC